MPIRIHGAAEHNLKHLDIDFPDGLTVVTGVSGSGKTSLVFDTLYHEARRRFLEIYALGSSELRLSPANVDGITGLSPAIAVGIGDDSDCHCLCCPPFRRQGNRISLAMPIQQRFPAQGVGFLLSIHNCFHLRNSLIRAD